MPSTAWLRPRSLRWRLTLALCAVLILAFLVAFFVVFVMKRIEPVPWQAT